MVVKNNKIIFWTAILDIINAVLFLFSWPMALGMAFADAMSHGEANSIIALLFYLMSTIGIILAIASLIESRNNGFPIIGSILSIIGNLLFFITAVLALPATVLLVIATILLFMNKKTKNPINGKPFYKIWWFWTIAAFLVLLLFLSHYDMTANNISSNSNTPSASTSSTSGKTKANKAKNNLKSYKNSNYSFKEGTFKCPEFTIKLTKTTVGIDKSDQTKGIIVYFDITNTSKKSLQPSEALYYLKLKQSNGKSNYNLDSGFDSSEALFPTHNDDGSILEDNDLYDSNSDKQDKFQKSYEDPLNADLLPGKTVTVVQGYKLKDSSHPVYVKAYKDDYSDKTVGAPYEINLQ